MCIRDRAISAMFITTLAWFILLNFMAAKGGSLVKKELTGKADKSVKYFMILLGLGSVSYTHLLFLSLLEHLPLSHK